MTKDTAIAIRVPHLWPAGRAPTWSLTEPSFLSLGILAGAIVLVLGTWSFAYVYASWRTTGASKLSPAQAQSVPKVTANIPKPTIQPTATPAVAKPPPVSSPTLKSGVKPLAAGSATSPSDFVTICGLNLCLHGAPFYVHGATGYGTYGSAAAEISLAQAGNVNVLELVEFDTQYHVLSDTESEATWTRVDSFIAAARASGLHVILNLSEYGQSLQAAGQTPTTTDWAPYLSFIANRTNTATGVVYKNDPTIAMVELFGEIDAPNYSIHPGTEGTTAQMTAFFNRTESEWRGIAPNILVSSGGFSYLNDSGSGIDWRSIMSDPANATCDIEVNSPDDLNVTVGAVTNYCKSIGKPWFLAAWSSCYNSSSYPFNTPTDGDMAGHAQTMYNLSTGGNPALYRAIGADFWNLENAGTPAGTCSLSPSFPQTWSVVQHTAP
jgi:hypothetical protein